MKRELTNAEIERLKESLKRSYKERFLFATNLYKMHMQAVHKASITYKPFGSKYAFNNG